jgi:dolichol-phosphate mannosyltransferase
MNSTPLQPRPLSLLSIVIPARNEEGCIEQTISKLNSVLKQRCIAHEIIAVDDGSTDQTWAILLKAAARIPELKPIQNNALHGFGRAIICGLDKMSGDAVVIMMADESDDCDDVVRYWDILCKGFDCVFGSRFIKGSAVYDYPAIKLIINRCANFFLKMLFGIRLNDTTNAFKAYRREVIEGCRPLIAPHFNLTVELPLKAIVRGFSWTTMPISWRNRRTGTSKLKIKEMGSRYLFICLYIWLEKYFSMGDYRRINAENKQEISQTAQHQRRSTIS